MAPALQASTAMLARRQLASSSLVAARLFVAQQRGYATPQGPPPANFRTSRQVQWTWDKQSTLDRVGKFFLMTEMARGMYVLLEQFFRPPYVYSIAIEKSYFGGAGMLMRIATPSTTPSRRYARELHVSARTET